MDAEELKKRLEEQSARIEELSAKIAALEKMKSEGEEKILELEEEKKDIQILSEKTNAFNQMLIECKVVEAQRLSFIENDMVKFASLSGKIKLTQIGKEGDPVKVEESRNGEEAEEEILKLATQRSKETGRPYHLCISEILNEHKKLSDEYQTKFN